METEPKTSIKQMKETIKEAGLSTADLLERPHVQARYTEAVARLAEAEQLKTGDNFAKRACTSKLGKPAGRESRDWRATLFVWRGELEPIFAGHHSDYDGPPMNPSITWQGAWLSADDDTMPTEAALHASTNTFKLKTSTFDEEKIREKGDATWSGQNLQREDKNDFLATDEILEEIFWEAQGEDEMETRKAFFALDRLFEMKFDGSSYKLDVGNGLEDVKDVEHRWAGTTPFGRFVSLGVIDGSTMTLARRYIADDDPRAAWASPEAVLDAVFGDGPLVLADIPAKLPWKVEA